MTKEEKHLLLIDLSSRLPYHVKCRVVWDDTSDRILTPVELFGFEMNAISEIKPYLRPMSSMTKEELSFRSKGFKSGYEYYDWLNAHHFDYRGLIPMGLALEAKEGMYKTE